MGRRMIGGDDTVLAFLLLIGSGVGLSVYLIARRWPRYLGSWRQGRGF